MLLGCCQSVYVFVECFDAVGVLSVFTAAIEFLKCCYVVARVCSLLLKKKKCLRPQAFYCVPLHFFSLLTF